MGNPIITRLGVQQFWYNHWYSDNNISLNLQQDKLFENLIQIYLMYGLNIKENLFIHEYWYGKNKYIKKLRLNYGNQTKNTFYRRYYYTNTVVGIEHNFLLRNQSPEFFPFKLWLFKYNNWIIFNVVWFKPMKGKNKINILSDSASAANVLHKKTSLFFKTKRLKLLLLYFIKYTNIKTKHYQF